MLNPSQQSVYDSVLSLIESSNPQWIRITGSAGTGKTFLIRTLVSELIDRHKSVRITGLTNKATSLLVSDYDSHLVSVSTIHKLLSIKQSIDYNTGEIEFKTTLTKYDDPFKYIDVLIIDEASMMNTYIFDLLDQYLQNTSRHTTCILVGDPKQLPPVNEPNSIAFEFELDPKYDFHLTEIVRQAKDNPIIALSNNLSLCNTNQSDYTDTSGYVFTNNFESIINKLVESNGSDKCKYLAWTNDAVNKMNQIVRKRIYDHPDLLNLGETIVVDSPYTYNDHNLFTNQELKVEDLELDIITKGVTICQRPIVEFKDQTPGAIKLLVYRINGDILAVHEDCFKDFRAFTKNLKAKAISKELPWESYYRFFEPFLRFKYNHALTVHKSQGSTYETTIVNYNDLCRNRNRNEFQKLLYTAVTRSSERLIIYKHH
jgi:hypothetical protein